MYKNQILITALACVFSLSGFAQDKKKEWDVASPPTKGTYKDVEFTTTEGTWMNLDVSPDGKTIVFDMLGDIYRMPITGGTAKLLRGGLPFEVQPRFSPDGTKISFTSDAGGGDNIWIMDANGSNPEQITKESFRLLNNAVWTPDGQYLIARKHYTSQRSLGAGELWMYHTSGGSGVQLTKKKNAQQDAGEPCVSADGRYVYYSEDMYPGGYFQYNKDPNKQIYIIRRYDTKKGKIENIITGSGGAARPQISPDGKRLAFVRRIREQTILFVHDLETGEEWKVYDKLDKDQQEAWAIFGVYTNFAWLPGTNHVVIWTGGKIKKIWAGNPPDSDIVGLPQHDVTDIPFEVLSKHRIYDALKFPQEVSPKEFTAKVIRHAVTSPDGRKLVFNAAGYLWVRNLPKGTPQRLTTSADFEFEPSFSPDGKSIVYVTWNDENWGSIHRMDLKTKATTQLVETKGIYRTPRFSPDGSKVVYVKDGGNSHQGFTYTKKPGMYWVASAGGESTLITENGGDQPRFNKTGDRVFFNSGAVEGDYWHKHYNSVDLSGNDEQTHFTSKYGSDFVPSPDNKWVLFRELHKVYIAAFPEVGKAVDLSSGTTAVPVAQVAKDAGINLHWSPTSDKVYWTLGEQYFSNDLRDRFSFLDGAPKEIPPIDSVGIKVNLKLKTDAPEGTVVLQGARIITMKGDEVIENGDIVIKDNRIFAIGETGKTGYPKDAKIIDVKGKTIMPGLVDVHAHLGTFREGLSPQKQWSYYANLAYGVTTTHDPSSNTEMVFSQSEMVKAGHMIGPRVYSTGTILYGAEGDFKAVINNLDDARSAIRRTKAFGAFSVKSYNQPRREQRQQVIQAAREEGIMVYPEGGSFFFHNLSMVLDGHTGVEHNLPVATLYNDVIKFWSASKTGYTPTLIVCYGAMSGENYWYQHTNVWEKERLLKFTPRTVIDSRARHRTMAPESEYENGHIRVSQSCKKLTDAGVGVNLGAHGQLQGLGVHWELWMLSQGGVTNMQALRSATLIGAKYIGMDKDIGSLEEGKLADLIVLDKNPLDDIYNTESVKYTMINGRLYDAETMNEMGNYNTQRGKFYWEFLNNADAFQLNTETNSFEEVKCGCGKH